MADMAGENNSNTKLLLHFDDDLASTTFADCAVGGSSKTITALGDAQIERTPKWGFGAVGMHDVDSCVKVGQSDDFDFGLDDFTFDFWAKLTDPLRAHLFSVAADDGGLPDPDNMFTVERVDSQGDSVSFRFTYVLAGISKLVTTDSGLVDIIDAYHHFAIVRNGTSLALYVDGVSKLDIEATDDNDAPLDFDFGEWHSYVGGAFAGGAFGTVDGYYDEFRAQAEAVWTSGFTAPASAYTRTQRGRVIGKSVAYGSHAARAIGESCLAMRSFEGRAIGESHILNNYEGRAHGESGTLAGHEGRAIGESGIIRRLFHARAIGVSRILNNHEGRAMGESGIIVLRHLARAVGESMLYAPFGGRAIGESRILGEQRAVASGQNHIANTADDLYEAYEGIDAPDFSTPAATGASLPLTVPITGQGVHHVVVRRRNRYNELSYNTTPAKIELDGADDEIDVAPSPPEWLDAEPADGWYVRVRAHYIYSLDGSLAADQFVVRRQNITDAGPLEIVATETIKKVDGLARLDWTGDETFQAKQVLIKVSTKRSSDSRESSTIQKIVTFLTQVPGAPESIRAEKW